MIVVSILTVSLFTGLLATDVCFIRQRYGSDMKSKCKNTSSSASSNTNVNMKTTNRVLCPPMWNYYPKNVRNCEFYNTVIALLFVFVLSRAEKLRMRAGFCARRLA